MLKPHHAIVLACLVAAGCTSTSDSTSGARAASDELIERPVELAALPQEVSATLTRELAGNTAQEVEEIVYEGVTVLYEAEYMADGREVEIVIRPDGELIPRDQLPAEDDDPDAEGEDDDAAGARTAGASQEDTVSERAVTMAQLPQAVQDALRRELGEGPYSEIEEVRYEGIVILYEAESARGEIAFFPSGKVAQPLGQDQEDDADGAGEDDEDDRP